MSGEFFVLHIVHMTAAILQILIGCQRAVTCLENVSQLNKTRVKKLGFQLSHRQPLKPDSRYLELWLSRTLLSVFSEFEISSNDKILSLMIIKVRQFS